MNTQFIKKQSIILLFFMALNFNLYSQSHDEIDYLSYDYQYLDENYAIHIDSKTFDKAMRKYKAIRENIKSYTDSLSVITMLEFDDWQKSNKARYVISYSWKRLGYHTWQTPAEAENFAKGFNITHPWRMKEFLVDDTNNRKEILDLYAELKVKIIKKYPEIYFEGLNRTQVLNLAMENNPVRIRAFQEEQYQKHHGKIDPDKIGKGCGKDNCCQEKVK